MKPQNQTLALLVAALGAQAAHAAAPIQSSYGAQFDGKAYHCVDGQSYDRQPDAIGMAAGFIQFSESNPGASDNTVCSDMASSALVSTALKVTFPKVSADASDIIADVSLSDPNIHHWIVGKDNSITLRYQGAIQSCDGVNVTAFQVPTTVQELVSGLAAADLHQFFQCTLNFSFVTSNEILYSQLHYSSSEPSDVMTAGFEGAFSATVLQNGMISIGMAALPDPLTNRFAWDGAIYPTAPSAATPDATQRVMDAATDFVNLVKDHGNQIILTSQSGVSAAEKVNLLAASLQVKKPQLAADLQAINGGFGELQLLDKLSVSRSVNQAYAYLEQIEVQVGQLSDQSQRLNLGQLITQTQ